MNTSIKLSSNQSINLKEAQKFLNTLAPEGSFHFQTFYDRKNFTEKEKNQFKSEIEKAKKQLAQTFTGSLSEHADELIRLNKLGAGIFVAVNEVTGPNRSNDNVTGIRAFFIDKDNGRVDSYHIPPSIIIPGPGGEHAYWLVENGIDIEEFRPLQKKLIERYDSDRSVHDPCRVLRLPGFLHAKDPTNPVLIQCEHIQGSRYTLEAVKAGLPEEEKSLVTRKKKTKKEKEKAYQLNLSRFNEWAKSLPIQKSSENILGGRNKTVLLLCREGLGLKIENEDIENAVIDYCNHSLLEPSEALNILARQTKAHTSEAFSSYFVGSDKNSRVLAESFIRSRVESENCQTSEFIHYKGEFYIFNGKIHEKFSADEIGAEVAKFAMNLLPKGRSITPSFVKTVLQNITGLCHLSNKFEINSWLSLRSDYEITTIPTNSGCLVVSKNEKTSVELIPSSSDFFSCNLLPFPYDKSSKCPIWEGFLKEMIPDSKSRDFLQEWFGYNLTPMTSFGKFVNFFGEGANGKTVILTVLRALLGDKNVSSVNFESFNSARTFNLASTVGKLANVIDDQTSTNKFDEGLLKSFVSGGRITLERKNKDPFETTPTAKISMASNHLIHFKDRTDGIWRRFVAFPMTVQILDESKHNPKMLAPDWWHAQGEMSGLLNWALEGLKRLLDRGHFEEPPASKEAKRNHRLDSNPLKAFLEEAVILDKNACIGTKVLFDRYKKWAEGNNFHLETSRALSKQVERQFPPGSVKKSKNPVKAQSGLPDRQRIWKGLRFTEGNSR